MNMFEEARALQGTIKMCGISQGQIAERLGVSQSYIANKLRLLKFSSRMQEKITECGLCERQARTLLRVKDERLQEQLLAQITKKHMNVAQTETAVDALLEEKAEIRASRHSDLDQGLAACLGVLRLYASIKEHRVTEEAGEVILHVRITR